MSSEQKSLEEFVAKFQFKQQPPVLDIEDWKQLFNNQLFQIICDQLPIGISICIDPSCREIRHNTVAAGFFRIDAWDNLSHSSPDSPPLKLFINENEVLPEEMPIQRSMWSGQAITDLEVSLLWEDGIKKIIIFNTRPLFDANGKVIGAVATSEDITERKAAEDALRESRARLSLALFAGRMGFWDINRMTGQGIWNEECFRILGYQPGEVKPGYPALISRIHPEDRTKANTLIRSCFEQGGELSGEFRTLWPDGTTHWFELRGLIEKDGRGRSTRHYGIIADITDRKHREQERDNLMQEIDRERARSQAIIEALPVGLFLADAQGKLLLVNDVAYDVCGGEVYFASDASDYSPYKCWWTDTGEKLASEDFPLIRSLKGETCKNAAIDFERLNGTMSSQLISSAPIVTSDGRIDGSIAIAQDITERMRERKALSDSEARFRKLFYDSPDAMVILNREDGCRVDINGKYQELVGYSREKIVGRTFGDLPVWADSANKKADYLKKLQEEGFIQNYEFKIRNKSGDILTVLSSAVLIEWENKPCQLTIMRDITKEKEMEAELARLDRLNLIGEMAASIGHEIRNPMTSVRGFLQMLSLKTEYTDDLPYFDLMIEELDRANSIISEYLNMAKNKKVNLQRHCLDSLIKSIYPIIQADARNSDMNTALELTCPPALQLDASEIRQLVLNMARNGLDQCLPAER